MRASRAPKTVGRPDSIKCNTVRCFLIWTLETRINAGFLPSLENTHRSYNEKKVIRHDTNWNGCRAFHLKEAEFRMGTTRNRRKRSVTISIRTTNNSNSNKGRYQISSCPPVLISRGVFLARNSAPNLENPTSKGILTLTDGSEQWWPFIWGRCPAPLERMSKGCFHTLLCENSSVQRCASYHGQRKLGNSSSVGSGDLQSLESTTTEPQGTDVESHRNEALRSMEKKKVAHSSYYGYCILM